MADEHLTDLRSILRSAREEFQERWTNYRDDFGARGEYASDVIAEIADSSIPVYTSDLLALACEDNSLVVEAPELGAAFDGSPTPANIIAANVYERVTADLFEAFDEIQKEATEDDHGEAEAERRFPVLQTDRLEVAASVVADEGDDVLELMDEGDLRSNALACRVLDSDDETFEYLARKAGDYLTEGGDYFLSLALAAETVLGTQTQERVER